MKRHRIASVLAAGALLLTFAGTAAAEDIHQTLPISSSDATQLCTGGPGGTNLTPAPGEIDWVFIHSGNGMSSDSGTLTATFVTSGQKQVASYIQGGTKYLVVTTSPDTLTAASDTITGGQLQLSHVCDGGTTTTTTTSTSTSTSTTQTSTTQTSTTTTSTTQSSTTQSSTTQSSTTQSSTTQSETTGSSTTTDGTTTSATTTKSTPTGQVAAETGTPSATLPATDAVGGTGSSSTGGWTLLLAVGAVLTLSILILTPATKARRNK